MTVQLYSFYNLTHKANLDPRLLFITGTMGSIGISGINEYSRTIHHFDRKNLTFI